MFRKRAVPPVPVEVSPPVRLSPWRDGLGLLAIRSVQIIAVVTLAAGIAFALRTLSLVVIPVLIALILASAFEPVMSRLRRRIPPALATVLVLALVAAVLTGIGWLVTWAVSNQWDELVDNAVDGFAEIVAWVETLPFTPEHIDWDELVNDTSAWVTDFVTSAQFSSGALAGVGAVASFGASVVLMVVVLFFMLKDGPVIWEFVLRPFDGAWEARARRAGRKAVDTLGSYVRGTASVAAVDAIGIGVGLVILDVPLAPALAVLVFLLAFIPIVGAVLAGALAALIALVANGPVNALLVVAVVVLVNQLEGNLLQPVLMGRVLRLHALAILIVLTVGSLLGGIVGAIIAVPLAAVAWGVVLVWDGPDLPARWARPKSAIPVLGSDVLNGGRRA